MQVLELSNEDVQDLNIKDRANLAESTRSMIVLTTLSHDSKSIVRTYVAMNRATPEEVLKILSIDEDIWVRENLARNPSLPSYILSRLKDDTDGIKSAVARNPNTDRETLNILSLDQSRLVRTSVAKNPNTPPKSVDYPLGRDYQLDQYSSRC